MFCIVYDVEESPDILPVPSSVISCEMIHGITGQRIEQHASAVVCFLILLSSGLCFVFVH